MKLSLRGGRITFSVKPIIGITIILSLFSFIIFLPDLFPRNCMEEKSYLKKEIIGRVEKKFYDIKNHGNETIIYSIKGKKKNEIFSHQSELIFHYIHVGDSLYKPVGTLEIQIVRDGIDTVFTIDCGCD